MNEKFACTYSRKSESKHKQKFPCNGLVLVKEQLNGLSGTAISFD